jgi:hypothetical protein
VGRAGLSIGNNLGNGKSGIGGWSGVSYSIGSVLN